MLQLFFFSSSLSVFRDRIPLGNPVRSGTLNVPMWTRPASESQRSAYSLWPPSTGIKGVNYECITAWCVRVWERKKKRDRQTEVGGCACYASQADFELLTSRLPAPASGVSRTTGMHVTAPTPSLPLVKLALLVIFSPTLWPKHWEEQLSVIVLESSPQALVPLIQALGRGRGREGCSPHCGQGAENTEGTEDQAEPWKLCPPPPPPVLYFLQGGPAS